MRVVSVEFSLPRNNVNICYLRVDVHIIRNNIVDKRS